MTNSCQFCGEEADHRCGNYHSCGNCCSNMGELVLLDERLYDWVWRIAENHQPKAQERPSRSERAYGNGHPEGWDG